MGSAGIFPVKKSQSTALFKANSAAEPAKINRTNSVSPQIFLTIEPRVTKSDFSGGPVRLLTSELLSLVTRGLPF
jgi:hypothetical protein